jgi:hypothetical protein
VKGLTQISEEGMRWEGEATVGFRDKK